jgi:predicted proteasome-type protease
VIILNLILLQREQGQDPELFLIIPPGNFIRKLNEFNFDQERPKGKWLEDMAWRNYEILTGRKAFKRTIDSIFC